MQGDKGNLFIEKNGEVERLPVENPSNDYPLLDKILSNVRIEELHRGDKGSEKYETVSAYSPTTVVIETRMQQTSLRIPRPQTMYLLNT